MINYIELPPFRSPEGPAVAPFPPKIIYRQDLQVDTPPVGYRWMLQGIITSLLYTTSTRIPSIGKHKLRSTLLLNELPVWAGIFEQGGNPEEPMTVWYGSFFEQFPNPIPFERGDRLSQVLELLGIEAVPHTLLEGNVDWKEGPEPGALTYVQEKIV